MSDRPTTGVTSYLTIRARRGAEALAFYEAAFAAEVVERQIADDGERIMYAGMKINAGFVMLSDEFPEYGGGETAAPSGVTMHLQVDDTDAWMARAVAAGATVTMPAADQFWGDRYGRLVDPFGHSWSIGAPLKG